MHHAPPVSYPVGRSRMVGLALLAAGAAGSVTMTYWMGHGASSLARQLAWLGTLALVAWSSRQWLRTPTGMLHWNGEAWHWAECDAVPGRIVVCLDLQHLLLLRWQPPAGSCAWLWLERHREPTCWADLRRAVYSRANPDALPEARPPAANS